MQYLIFKRKETSYDVLVTNKLWYFVSEPPEIQPFHFPENLQEGKRTQLSCTIVSGDFPIDITWNKDSRPLTPDPDLQEQNHNFVSVLLFRKLAARHAGHYTCIARNAAAQTNYTAKLIIRGEVLNCLFLYSQNYYSC